MNGSALPFDLLARLLDAALDLDPEARQALAGLSGKTIDLDITGIGGLRLRIDGERVRVEPRDETLDADVTIRGAPLSLLRFVFAGDRETLLLGEEVRLHGDIALATRLQQIAGRMDIDIEEAIAERLGDVPAHELMRAVRGLGGWMRTAGAALLADASEYLRYETAVTPGTEDVERFRARRRGDPGRCRAARGPHRATGTATGSAAVIGLRQILRLAYINIVLVRHGLDDIVLGTHLLRPIRFLLYLLPWNWIGRTQPPRAVRLRRTLEDLGPIFIKLGQILSTRRDLLPEDIADEFASLQDRVPPFPGETAAAIVRAELGRPVEEIFSEFALEPLASASIAQVHAARLADGREVVVKVVRPEIEKVIRRDVSLMRLVADLAHRYWLDARRLHPREVVAEYEKTILDELDLLREAASASQLRRNFEGSDLLYVPEVHWEYTRRRVMVMERVSGIPISNVDALLDAGIDLRTLAERGVEIFFTQLDASQLLPRRHAPGEHLRRSRPPRSSELHRGGLRHHGGSVGPGPALSRREFPRVLQSGLSPGGGASRGVEMGSGRHPHRRVRGRDSHRVRTDIRPSPEGDLLRARSGATVPDHASFPHGGAAAARPAAKRPCSTSRVSAVSSIPTSTCGRLPSRFSIAGCESSSVPAG